MNVYHPSTTSVQLHLPDPGTVHAPDDVFDLLEEYIESTSSQLEELEQAALAYEQGNNQDEYAGSIRRILHKIKGESGMVGFQQVEKILHEAENAFEALEVDHRADMLLKLRDWLTEILEHMAQ